MSYAVQESPELDTQLAMPDGKTVTVRDLAEALPHGSGIDGKWHVTNSRNRITFHGDYHAMNDAGYYCGWHAFKVVLFRHRTDVRHALCGPLTGKVQVSYRKGDWDYKVVGLRGRLADAGDWIREGVSYAWREWPIGCMRQDVEPA